MVEKNRLMLMVESISKFSTGVLVDLTSKVAMKVLHVDDDLDCLKVAEQCLEMQGRFRVDTVRSAEEAMEKMKKETYDVIISDYQMPGKNGLEFLKELREKGNNTPFIIFTGKDRKEVAIKALNFGADGYFNKHGDPETVYGELAHGIRQAIERKKAEMKIWEREERLRAVFGSSPDAITVSDLHGNILDCNEAAWKMLGFSSKEEVIGKSSFDFIAKKDRQKALENLKKTLEQGTTRNVEYALLNKDGDELWGELSASIIRDSVGNPVCFVGVIRDTSERKKAEASLRESEEKNRKTIENANVGIITYDSEGEVKVLNPKMEEMTGFKRKEIPTLVNWFEKLYPNEEERRKVRDKWFKRMSGEGEVKEGHAIITTKEGKRRNFLFNGVQLESGDSIAFAHDITERKKAEEERRETKDYLDNLLNYANAPIIVWDNENKISLFNNAFEVLTGYKKESVLGRNIDVLFPPLQKEEILQTIEKATKGEKWQSVEVPILCKGKETRIALWNSANITDKDGNIVATIAQGQDITERKQAEEALKESEEKFRNLFENARDIIFTTDLKGNITEINRFVEKYGFKRDEVVGKNMLKFVPKKYWPKLLRGVAKLSQGNLVEGEIEIITPKGKIISEYRSNPIRREKKVVGFQTILRNITERKAMEERLRQYSGHLEELVQKRTKELLESEKRYSVLVEEANVGVATLQDGKIVFANKKGEEIVGYSKEELFGLPFMKLVSEEHRQIVMERYAQRIKGESVPATYEIEVNAKNGEHIPVEISAAHISYQGHPADLIIVRDIREKKRMEEQRSKLERLASIGELAAMVGHDLRNPLTGIMGAAYYLKTKHGTEVGAKGKEMLETIEKAINYSNKIINDLLEYSRDLKLKLTETTPKTMLQRALSLLEVPEKIQIVDNTKDKPMVKADTEKIRKVFVNIIQNAIDAMPEGGTLTIKSRKVKDTLEIAFKDTGAGMSEETLSKLKGGVPLFTTKSKGMGFGLPICKRLAEAHGGKLSVESPAGKGTTVTVTIPVNPEPVDEGEEKWIFSESMLSAITSTQRAP